MDVPCITTSDGANDKGNLSFSAWGKRRTKSWAPITASVNFLSLLKDIEADAVKLGYTGHEMDDDVGLVNMKGRLYDADLGRFISADPHIQAPDDTQSYNRYSYVNNNPLSYTDPSGYFSKSFNKIMRSVVAIFIAFAVSYPTGPDKGVSVYQVIAGGAVGGFVATGTAEGAWQGAFTALLFYGVGEYFGKAAFNTGKYYAKVAAHGVVGGVSSMLHGGKFKHGFFSAAFTQAVAPGIDDHIDTGNKGISLQRTMAAAVVGGTASEISGGKFANGAVTGAFSRLFNDEITELTLKRKLARLRTTQEFLDAEEIARNRWGKLSYEIGSSGSSSLKGRIIIDPLGIGTLVPTENIPELPGSIANLSGDAYWDAFDKFQVDHASTPITWERLITHELMHSAYGSQSALINDHHMIIQRTNDIVGFYFNQPNRSPSYDGAF